jgi:WD40 repeat protein
MGATLRRTAGWDGRPVVGGAGPDAAFTPDGATIVVQEAGSVNILAAGDGTLLRSLEAQDQEQIRGFALLGQGSEIVVASYLDMELFRLADGQRVETISGTPQYPLPANVIAASPDGDTLAVGSVRWDFLAAEYPPLTLQDSAGHVSNLDPDAGTVIGLAYSRDGSRLAAVEVEVGDSDSAQTVVVYDPVERRRVWAAELASPVPIGVEQPRAGIAFSPSGEVLAYSDGVGVHLLRAEDGTPLPELDGFASAGDVFTSLAFSPDGSMVAAGQTNGTVTVWCGP